jgi:hypothetical protein
VNTTIAGIDLTRYGRAVLEGAATLKRLVFVIGAGASKDFGEKAMPVGTELANRIEARLNTEFRQNSRDYSGPIASALMRCASGMTEEMRAAANKIAISIHAKDSIDDLLDEWRDRPQMIRVGNLRSPTRCSRRSAHLLSFQPQQEVMTRPSKRFETCGQAGCIILYGNFVILRSVAGTPQIFFATSLLLFSIMIGA